MFSRSIFRFRQDLRIHDNHGLIECIQNSKEILPIFIFDQNIIKSGPNNDPRIGFLIDAILHLESQLHDYGAHIQIFYGDPTQIIPSLVKNHDINAIYTNISYGYGSSQRDKIIGEYCKSNDIAYIACNDYLLVEPQQIEQRKVFTPFSALWHKHIARNPIQIMPFPEKITSIQAPESIHITGLKDYIPHGTNIYRPIDMGQGRLTHSDLDNYELLRNIPSVDGTSKLSPYIRFGIISIREVYLKMKHNQTFINELARREFRQHINYYFPETRVVEFQEKKRKIERKSNAKLFENRCKGETGYPIVDAGMRQLQKENRMHGRVRMIVASFLCKDLLLDRRLGEQHFARYLIDYDTNVNIGNRQRSASVGADPKPLRIFNPILQSQKFDPECEYIVKYIPELVGSNKKAIHDPLKYSLAYHKPIVNHYQQSTLAKNMYYSYYS